MTAVRRAWAADLLHFWFHCLRPRDWFAPPARIDRELRVRYGRWLAPLAVRRPVEFLETPSMALSAVLLFDQVPRNINRGSRRAFACDPLARAIAKAALARGWDRALGIHQRQFLAMPLMHSEAVVDQRASVAYFTALGNPQILAFARSHATMIARFGRFPHRNEVLGRHSTGSERRAVEGGFAW